MSIKKATPKKQTKAAKKASKKKATKKASKKGSTAIKKAAKKATKKIATKVGATKVAPASFTLNKLTALSPCDEGLAKALVGLRKSGCVTVPADISAQFWASVEGIFNRTGDRYQQRSIINNLSPQVRITIKRDVFIKSIMTDANFQDYSFRIIREKGMDALKAALFESVRPKLLQDAQTQHANTIRNYEYRIQTTERDIRYLNQQLERSRAELERARAASARAPTVNDVNPTNMIHYAAPADKRRLVGMMVDVMSQTVATK